MECNCCGMWVHAECEQLCEEDFRLLCSTSDVDYICSLCCPDKNWAISLWRHANRTFSEILAKYLESMSSAELVAINDKANRSEYRSCAEFRADVRQLPDELGVTESDVLSAMPWVKCEGNPKNVVQKVTITAKVRTISSILFKEMSLILNFIIVGL